MTFKRLGLVFLALVVLAAVFHRPLVFRFTRYFIARGAQQQNLELRYEIDGSIFTSLRIRNLVGTPTESGPVERLEIGSLRLEYSLWGLIRQGLPGFLESAALVDVQVVIDPAKNLPPEKAREEQSFKFPALIPRELVIQNLNFTARRPAEDLVIENFHLQFDPQRAGFVRAALIQLPGFQTWRDFNAEARYTNRDLVLQNFRLGAGVEVARLNLDMSRLSEDVLAFGFAGTLFGGATEASGKIDDLNESSVLTVEAKSAGLSLAEAAAYFQIEAPLRGTLAALDLRLKGEVANPQTWSGAVEVRVTDFVMQKQVALDTAALRIEIADGKALVRSFDLAQAVNQITGSAEIDLPPTFDGFSKLDATGKLDAKLENLASISAGSASGAATATGTFALAAGQPSADLRVQADHVNFGKGEVNDADLRLQLGKNSTP